MAQVLLVQGSGDLSPVYFGAQPLPSCVASLELSWEILSPETYFLGCSLEWHSVIVGNRLLRSPRGSQVYWVSSSVFFHGVNPGVMPWYLDCRGGRKYYRVEAHSCGLELSLWDPDPDFQTLIRTWVPGAYSGCSLESFRSWLTPHKNITCWNCPVAMV